MKRICNKNIIFNVFFPNNFCNFKTNLKPIFQLINVPIFLFLSFSTFFFLLQFLCQKRRERERERGVERLFLFFFILVFYFDRFEIIVAGQLNAQLTILGISVLGNIQSIFKHGFLHKLIYLFQKKKC